MYWITTIALIDCAYYGKYLTICAESGYFAVYWGWDESARNTRVLNGFEWPEFPSGAGTTWSLDWWGRWSFRGPSELLSPWLFGHRLQYPVRFGFYWPGFGLGYSARAGSWPSLGYIGIPAWPIVVLGTATYFASRWLRSRVPGHCALCGYNRAGLSSAAVCPECGRPG